MAKIQTIEPQQVEVFKDGIRQGCVNEYELNDLRIQIVMHKEDGWYVKYNGDNITISPNTGDLSDWPEGLFDMLEKQLGALFRLGRGKILGIS